MTTLLFVLALELNYLRGSFGDRRPRYDEVLSFFVSLSLSLSLFLSLPVSSLVSVEIFLWWSLAMFTRNSHA